MKINYPSTPPELLSRYSPSSLESIQAHLSTLPLSVIVTASLLRWTSVLQTHAVLIG